MLPTLIAGLLYPWRAISGVPLDGLGSGEVRKFAHIFYLKPAVILLNVFPFCVFLILYVRFLSKYAKDDWVWLVGLVAGAWGTPLLVFNSVLNNHTVAAYSAFFALDAYLRIQDGGRSRVLFATVGFFGAFCACNELPAVLFAVILFLLMFQKSPSMTLRWFVPWSILPCAFFLATLYLAVGGLVPVYAEAGTEVYHYPGSFWNTPRGLEALDEPRIIYLYNMLVGHHGVLSLTPIFLFSAVGVVRLWSRTGPLATLARLTALLSLVVVLFYTFKTSNYGGATQGMRWLLWLIPFWLLVLPWGLEPFRQDPGLRKVALAALLISIFSVSYGLSMAWSHPWFLDLMKLCGVYEEV
ncbi:hypothetical protein V5E97_19215 [Singulisphaera sp. Ch08]|uniref:Glycosyltransferase RgtA/B/C/D-like domain-containing protein n=1 Tax=Singulisphaera sp. Ch08 TaxID=3120278 RepID=A0AAU7CSN0_9BACT